MISKKSISKEDALTCVGDGWASLVSRFYDKAEALSLPICVTQVKEKFGTLRLDWVAEGKNVQYSNPEYTSLDKALNLLALESGHICESCGADGKMVKHKGWIKTCCDNCFKEWVES